MQDTIPILLIGVFATIAVGVLPMRFPKLRIWQLDFILSFCIAGIITSITSLTPMRDTIRCLCIVVGFVSFVIPMLVLRFYSSHKEVKHSIEQLVIVSSDKAISIKKQEPKRRPQLIFDIVILLAASLILIYGIWIIVISIENNVNMLTWNWIVYFLVILGIPAIFFTITIQDYTKYYKIGKSRKYRCATSTFPGVISTNYINSWEAIKLIAGELGYSTILLEKHSHIRVAISGTILDVQLTQGEGRTSNLTIESDAILLSTVWDFGKVRNNLERFEHILRFGVDKNK